MEYYEFLRGLLLPLGVYDMSDGTYSMAELRVLGEQLDAVCAEIQSLESECFMTLSQTYGLDAYRKILPKSAAETSEEKQNAIIAMLSTNDLASTVSRIDGLLAGCGTGVELRETGEPFQIAVRFTDESITPEKTAIAKAWLDRFLPCHLEIIYE